MDLSTENIQVLVDNARPTEAVVQAAPRKRCAENMQQIYSRTPMSKIPSLISGYNYVHEKDIQTTWWKEQQNKTKHKKAVCFEKIPSQDYCFH